MRCSWISREMLPSVDTNPVQSGQQDSLRRTDRRFSFALLVAIAIFSFTAGPAFSAGPDFLFPHEPAAIRLRVELQLENQAPEVAWNLFLDKWFDFFDRDANGLLNEVEVARVLPLPLLDQKHVSLSVKEFDANGDGQGSREEIKAFYLRAGFAPVVGAMRPPADDALRMSDTLFLQLDGDQNGTLTKAELDQAPGLLKRLDEDEDEVLTAAELLAFPRSPNPANSPSYVASTETAKDGVAAQVVLKVAAVSPSTLPVTAVGPEAATLVEAVSAPQASPVRLRLGHNYCAILLEEGGKPQSFKSARSFYLAQFRTIFGAKDPVTRQQLGQDAALAIIAEQFDVGERDGDGKLSLDELSVLLTLIEQGISSQTVVTLTSHGRSLLEMLDQDHDGRLVLRELNSASQLLSGEQLERGLPREQIPIQFQLHMERGTPGATFGPIPIPARTRRAAATTAEASASGPRWFQSLDRNSDGTLSPREFPGNPERFRKLDANQDGLISRDEAEAASPPKP